MKVWFRTDAALWMGNGHVMRCLTLAHALEKSGAECGFICRMYEGNLGAKIRAAGYPVFELPDDGADVSAGTADFSDWLQDSVNRDAALTLQLLQGRLVDWLIVDHYALTADWERLAGQAARHLMVIDDLVDRHHVCDLLLDQTLGRSSASYRHLVPGDATLLCGAEYALIREAFPALRASSLARRQSGPVRHLLVSMGGVDSDNVTGRVLEVLAAMVLPDRLHITVVLGPHAPWIESVRDHLAALPRPASLLVDVHDMAALLADADLVIGAAGSSAWERCCLGVPAIMVVMAGNQRSVAASLSAIGAAAVIERTRDISERLPFLLQTLLDDDEARKQMSTAAASVTDGTGVAKVEGALRGTK